MAENLSAADVAPSAAVIEHATTDSYVEWSAIFAGAALASAISFVLLTFGAAIGLSLSSPFSGEGMSLVAIAIATGLWILWVELCSFWCGAYLAGRMRRRMRTASDHETSVRDGAHGLLVWAAGVLIGAALAMGGLSGLSGAAMNAAGDAAAMATANINDSLNPDSSATVDMFRASPGDNREMDVSARASAASVLARDAHNRNFSEADRNYVASIIAQETGVSDEEAQTRATNAYAESTRAMRAAEMAAEAARKSGIVAAFFLAASLLVSAAAAYAAAMMGGRHRDKAAVFPLWAAGS